MSEDGYTIIIGAPQLADVLQAARQGDMQPANDLFGDLRDGRVETLRHLGNTSTETRRIKLLEYLQESRASEQALRDALRHVADEKHAAAMVDLTDRSNAIAERLAEAAEQANTLATGLDRSTKVLAGATVVLAIATIALIFATLAG